MTSFCSKITILPEGKLAFRNSEREVIYFFHKNTAMSKNFSYLYCIKKQLWRFRKRKRTFSPVERPKGEFNSFIEILRNTTTISGTCLNILNSVNNTIANKAELKLIPKAFPLFNRKLNGEWRFTESLPTFSFFTAYVGLFELSVQIKFSLILLLFAVKGKPKTNSKLPWLFLSRETH